MPDSTPTIAVRAAHEPEVKPLGPSYLKVVDVDFLKPDTRAKGARTTEQDATLPAGVLSAPNDGGWE
jgi:hypothetical protein